MYHEIYLLKAIRYFKTQHALAKAINASQQQIHYWLTSGKRIPYNYVLKIEAATNGFVSRHDLAPNEEANEIVDELIDRAKRELLTDLVTNFGAFNFLRSGSLQLATLDREFLLRQNVLSA